MLLDAEGVPGGLRMVAPDYSLFRDGHLDEAACTWHQHGVFHLEEGMESLTDMKDGDSLMYIDKVNTNGTWIVTTLDPDFHYGSYFMPATEKFLDGFFPWLANGEILFLMSMGFEVRSFPATFKIPLQI